MSLASELKEVAQYARGELPKATKWLKELVRHPVQNGTPIALWLWKAYIRHPILYTVLGVLSVLSAYAVVWRFAFGLGASSDLSDAYPWGLWIAFKLCLVPMGGCGFVMAALVYIFGLERLRPLVRLGVLCGMLLYSGFVISLLIDLGLPWRIYQPIYMWQPDSIMFEIAWCVMLYLTVLIMEFLPSVAERLPMIAQLIRAIVMGVTGLVGVMIVVVFGKSTTAVGVGCLAVLLLAYGAWRRRLDLWHAMIIALVIEGIILSTLHQSSLGSLFLITKHKMESLFFTPLIPLFYFLSAITGGLACVLATGIGTSWAVGRKIEMPVYSSIARGLPYALAAYLVLRMMDIVLRGQAFEAFEPRVTTTLFWLEIIGGVAVPMALLLIPDVVNSEKGIFWTSVVVVGGLCFNRFNWSLLAHHPYAITGRGYFPSFLEIMLSVLVALFAGFAYVFLVWTVPVFSEGPLGQKRTAQEA